MTLCFVSLVHGKTGWILTNATFLKSYYFDTKKHIQKNTISKILHLIGRLYIGEEANQELFDFIENNLNLISNPDMETEDIKQIEIFIVFKLLEKLGYIEDHESVKTLASSEDYSDEVKDYISQYKDKIMPFINAGIRTIGL